MEEHRLLIKALGPILFIIWLILGLVKDLASSTISMVLAIVCAYLTVSWIDFVCKGNPKDKKHADNQ